MPDQNARPQAASGTSLGTEIRRLGYTLFIRIPEDRLECRCSYVPNQQGAMMSRDELIGFLTQNRIREGIDLTALDDFIVKAAAGIQQTDELIASGTPPLKGADALVSLTVKPSVIIRGGNEEKTQVDMHLVQTFINVSSGDEIGRIIPEQQGTPGRNIMGLPIPAQAGKPFSIKIGKNICVNDDNILIAKASGRFCQVSGEMSVEEEYVVAGDVNFKIGSINFNGVVDVHGDVLDHFDIVAKKGLRVSGNIGVCSIASDGDITFCGMDGQDKGSIVCGGTLRAHFIHDACVECAGDVIVDVEIHNCTIKTLGRIVVDKGAISGGSYIALGGIESKKIGSPASVRTKLSVGLDYRDVELLENLYSSLAATQKKVNESLSLKEIDDLKIIVAELTENIQAIRRKSDALANAKINIKTTAYDNVLLSVNLVSEEITEEKNGSLSVIENSIEGGLRFLPMTSLDVKATDIEKAFVREFKKMQGRFAQSG